MAALTAGAPFGAMALGKAPFPERGPMPGCRIFSDDSVILRLFKTEYPTVFSKSQHQGVVAHDSPNGERLLCFAP
jgi:hypothetical protein